MNDAQPSLTPLDDASLDRLVDGSLSESDRRGLLLRLENDPEGWRRCALAFLEDQAWKDVLGNSAKRTHASLPPAPIRSRWRPARLAIAAGLLAATFAAGFATGEGFSARPGIAQAQPEPSPPPVVPAEAPAPAIRQVGYLDVVDRSSGEQPAGRLPIVDGPGVDGRWLGDQTPKIPEYVRAQWERKGYQVAEHRRIVSVVLQDGRQVAVPLDEVELEYVGQQPN